MWVLKRGDWFVFLKLLQKILEVHSGLWPLVWSEVSPWISSTRWSSARPLSHYHSCLPTIANSKFCHSSFWTSPRPAHQSPASLLPLSMRHHHHMPRPFWKPPHWTSPSLLALLRTSFCPPLDASPHGSQWYFFFLFNWRIIALQNFVVFCQTTSDPFNTQNRHCVPWIKNHQWLPTGLGIQTPHHQDIERVSTVSFLLPSSPPLLTLVTNLQSS